MEEMHGAIPTKENKVPLLMADTIMGKRKGDQDENNTNCDKCGLKITSEWELRLHNASDHIAEKHVTVGTKRDESFLTRSDSFSPVRKMQILETHSDILTNEPEDKGGNIMVYPEDVKEK